MISYLLLFSISIFFLYPKKIKINDDIIYALIFCSFTFSHSILGFISLILISINASKFPVIIIISLISFIFFLNRSKYLNIFPEIKKFFLKEFNNYIKNKNENFSEKMSFYVILILLILLLISSIGPINHPDASDYHVGYPFQYYLKGTFFIDGGLHQGLLGIGDYANLAFIQENNIWLIRTLQIINLPILILFLSRKLNNNIFLIVFLSVPTFIQWSTIGKPLFLAESSLISIYLLWNFNKNPYTLKLLAISIINCICFKISSLLVIFPIFIDILFHIFIQYKSKREIINFLKGFILRKELMISILIFLSLFINRFIITGNFFYPFLTNIFNNDDQLIIQFSQFLRDYGRDKLFLINLFIPTKISDLPTSIGLNVFLVLILLSYEKIKNFNFKKDNIFLITISEILILILFCQGRSNYYLIPLILIIFQTNNINKFFVNPIIKLIFYTTLITQLIIMNLFLSFSIVINLLTLSNYEKYMDRFAYGFNTSRLMSKGSDGNILITDRNTRLFYPRNYIDKDEFERCLIDESKRSINPNDLCLSFYNINQIITNKDISKTNNNYICKEMTKFKATRNIFNRRKYSFQYCKKKIN